MQFLNPEYLLLVFIIVVIYLIFRRFIRSRESTLAFPMFGGFRQPASSVFRVPRLLDAVAALCFIIAFARPVSLEQTITPPIEGKDIMIALDASGSMEALDFQPKNRLEAAKTVIDSFVEGRSNDRIGLVFFSKEAFLQVPLTTDYSMFSNLMQKITTGVIEDGTAIGNGLGLALSRLEDSKAKSKVIILLTDGDNNSGNVSPDAAADLARKLGVKVYTIMIGTDKPVPFPAGKDIFGRDAYNRVTMKTNPQLLSRIAKTTDGKFYKSISTQELMKAFSDIDKLEKSPVPAKTFKLYEEYASWFILAGILLLLLARILALVFPLYPEVER